MHASIRAYTYSTHAYTHARHLLMTTPDLLRKESAVPSLIAQRHDSDLQATSDKEGPSHGHMYAGSTRRGANPPRHVSAWGQRATYLPRETVQPLTVLCQQAPPPVLAQPVQGPQGRSTLEALWQRLSAVRACCCLRTPSRQSTRQTKRNVEKLARVSTSTGLVDSELPKWFHSHRS